MSLRETVQEDIDRGRAWVVMWASFLTFSVLGGMQLSSGMIHVVMLEKYGRDNASTAWVGALHTAIMNLAGPLCSIVVEKFSCRASIMMCGLMLTIGYMATAYAPSLEISIVTCGLIAGLGGGFGWTSNMIVTGFYFRRYRNLAQGISISGVGIGMLATAPVIQAAREAFGVLGYFTTMASISIHVLVFGMLMKPSSLETDIKRKRIQESRRLQETTKGSFIALRNYCDVFLCKAVFCLSFSLFLFSFGTYTLFHYLPNYAIHKGFSSMQASLLLSACGLSSIFGRIITGLAANSEDVDELLLYSASMGVIGIVSILYPTFSSFYSGQIGFAVILGCYFGSGYCVISTINTQYVGVKNMATALGIEMCFGGIGSMIGPIVCGMILDSTGSYDQIFALVGLSLLLGALLGLTTILCADRHEDFLPCRNVDLEIVTEKSKSGDILVAADAIYETDSVCQETQLLRKRETSV